jgi:hypothetical protein
MRKVLKSWKFRLAATAATLLALIAAGGAPKRWG